MNEIEKLKALLKVAKCPNIDCDNQGNIAVRDQDGDWEAEQCQWCYERAEAVAIPLADSNGKV